MAEPEESQPVSVANVMALDAQRRREYGASLTVEGGSLKLVNAAGEPIGAAGLEEIPVSFIEAL